MARGEGSLPGKPGDVNDRSIGIEIVNEETGRTATRGAIQGSELSRYLSKRYSIPSENLVGHKDVSDRKQDP